MSFKNTTATQDRVLASLGEVNGVIEDLDRDVTRLTTSLQEVEEERDDALRRLAAELWGIERQMIRGCGNHGCRDWVEGQVGMSLRAWFAGQALTGFCANPAIYASNGRTGWGLVNTTEADLAHYCGVMADAMLVALEKETPCDCPSHW
jgi:hypothetical protein